MESDNRWGNGKTIKSFKKVDRGCGYAGWTFFFLNRKYCHLESHRLAMRCGPGPRETERAPWSHPRRRRRGEFL